MTTPRNCPNCGLDEAHLFVVVSRLLTGEQVVVAGLCCRVCHHHFDAVTEVVVPGAGIQVRSDQDSDEA